MIEQGYRFSSKGGGTQHKVPDESMSKELRDTASFQINMECLTNDFPY